MSVATKNLIPGVALKPGEPRLTTIAVRPLDADDEGGDRFAVLAVTEDVEYVVWTVNGGNTVNGTYVRFVDRYERVFADTIEHAFLRALGDWLCRI